MRTARMTASRSGPVCPPWKSTSIQMPAATRWAPRRVSRWRARERRSELVALLAAKAELGGAGRAEVAVGRCAGDEDGVGSAGVVPGGPPACDGEGLLATVLVL
jgi:hypothetical protein